MGRAKLAAEALRRSDLDAALGWKNILRNDCGGNRILLGEVLAEAGYRYDVELALRVVDGTLGNSRVVGLLYRRLSDMKGERAKADYLVLKHAVCIARRLSEQPHRHPNPPQRIYKVLVRHVSVTAATKSFRRAGLQIVVPAKVRWAIDRTERQRPRRVLAATGC